MFFAYLLAMIITGNKQNAVNNDGNKRSAIKAF
jgi:hypothetical protein